MKSFLVGAVAGMVVMWLWGDQLRDAVDSATADVRSRAAEQLQGAADTLQSVAETVDQGLGGAPQHRALLTCRGPGDPTTHASGSPGSSHAQRMWSTWAWVCCWPPARSRCW